MLDHFQRRRNELQLLAAVAADFLAELAAAGTKPFFVGQFVNYLTAGKVIGQRSAAVALALLLLPGFVFAGVIIGRVVRAVVVGGNGIFEALFQFVRQQFDLFEAEQRQLIRINAFLLRAVLFAEDAVQLLLQAGEYLQLLFDRLVLRGDDRFVLRDRLGVSNNRLIACGQSNAVGDFACGDHRLELLDVVRQFAVILTHARTTSAAAKALQNNRAAPTFFQRKTTAKNTTPKTAAIVRRSCAPPRGAQTVAADAFAAHAAGRS